MFSTFVSLKGVKTLSEMEQKQFPFFSVRRKAQQSPVTPLRCFISVFSVSHSDTAIVSLLVKYASHRRLLSENENYRKADGKYEISKHKDVEEKLKLGTCPVLQLSLNIKINKTVLLSFISCG